MPVRSTTPKHHRPPPRHGRNFRPAALIILGIATLGCSDPPASPPSRPRRRPVVRHHPGDRQGPPTPTDPPAAAPPTTPARNCHPSYEGACLDPTASDYDCAGGSGNGPKYVQGPVKVRPPDPFDLDADADGLGCEPS